MGASSPLDLSLQHPPCWQRFWRQVPTACLRIARKNRLSAPLILSRSTCSCRRAPLPFALVLVCAPATARAAYQGLPGTSLYAKRIKACKQPCCLSARVSTCDDGRSRSPLLKTSFPHYAAAGPPRRRSCPLGMTGPAPTRAREWRRAFQALLPPCRFPAPLESDEKKRDLAERPIGRLAVLHARLDASRYQGQSFS